MDEIQTGHWPSFGHPLPCGYVYYTLAWPAPHITDSGARPKRVHCMADGQLLAIPVIQMGTGQSSRKLNKR
ncbi:hypothetical protein FRX31_027724 [Thalictrum thalictroides]|uniref:Uncharacterized protein n=1 Tax=Thalictrum thalictroides TaxID=46969 RepID=A0A7J6VDJ9_THATH|nr:hypothetical protein FRX31_027724 [Thalictrum thalictroides]